MKNDILALLKDGPEQRLVVGPIVERLVNLGWDQKQIVFGKNEWKIPKTPSEASKREKNTSFDYFPVMISLIASLGLILLILGQILYLSHFRCSEVLR